MTKTYVEVLPNSTGEKIALQQLSNGADNVDHQEIVIIDDSTYPALRKNLEKCASVAGSEK